MEEVIDFITGYIDAEYEALRATYLEPNDDILASKMKAATDFMLVKPGHVMSLGFGRRPGMTPEEIARDADWVEDFQERVLFQVKHYHHETWGDLYACVVSSNQKLQLLAYGSCFFVARTNGNLKVIAHYTPGATLPSGVTQWEYLEGSVIEDPGELIEVRKLLAPQLPSHLADYNAA